MVEFVIPVIFSGLIAFIPNDYRHAEFMTAYMLNSTCECVHAPQIIIVGCLSVEINSHNCTVFNNAVVCDHLADVDIMLDPTPTEKVEFLGSAPSRSLPQDINDGESMSWLVHLDGIGGGVRRAKSWEGGLKEVVGARFRFGWDDSLTCKLDEGNEQKIHSFEFCKLNEDMSVDCSEGTRSPVPPQAIAESLMFKVKVAAGPIKVTLMDRSKKDRKTIISLACPNGYCPVITISNDMVDKECEKHNMEYGFHFSKFYSALRDEGASGVFIPHRLDDAPMEEKLVSNNCNIKVYKKELAQLCPTNFPDTKPDNRAICPPVRINP